MKVKDLDPLNELADTHRETVRSALKSAFGRLPIDVIAPINGGASGAFPFRVEVGGCQYVVRVEGPSSPLRNPHQYVSMQIAAEAGIAPRIHYLDATKRVVVMDFVDERPLDRFPGGPRAVAQAMGDLLRRVQATPAFPRFVDYPQLVRRLYDWVCRTGLFAPGILNPCTDHLARICEAYARTSADSLSSHNDPVPRNVLFDGERLWLIDWESAYRNDPVVDIAIALDSFASSPELETLLLSAWLGRAPDDELCARLDLVRALTRLYYAGVLLSASAASLGALADNNLSAPTNRDLVRDIRNGKIEPGTAETKHLLGKMYLASFLSGHAPPGLTFAVH